MAICNSYLQSFPVARQKGSGSEAKIFYWHYRHLDMDIFLYGSSDI